MLRRMLGLLSLTILAGPAAAQEEYSLDVPSRGLVLDMRNGKKPVKAADGSVDPTAQRAVDNLARYTMLRITSDVNRGLKPGRVEPMVELYKEAAYYVLEVPPPPKKINDFQKDYIQLVGKACVAQLRTVFGSPDKPSKYEPLVRVNGARLLALVARSGYEESADLAIDLIDNPKESDAVRLYALQTLKNLFGAINPDDPARSTVAKPERELKAVQTLIAFVTRKPAITADTPPEEVEAVRYVRREAIRALGNVRKSAYRKDKQIIASPALVLLKVTAGDPVILPVPNVSERVEAMAGYLQLTPDREENMDYVVFFLAKATRDLAVEYRSKQLINVNPQQTPKESLSISQRDYYGWKAAGARLEGSFKEWKAAWDLENPASPQPAAKLITDLMDEVNRNVWAPIQSPTPNVNGDQVDAWLQRQLDSRLFTSQALFKDDPTSTIVYPNQ